MRDRGIRNIQSCIPARWNKKKICENFIKQILSYRIFRIIMMLIPATSNVITLCGVCWGVGASDTGRVVWFRRGFRTVGGTCVVRVVTGTVVFPGVTSATPPSLIAEPFTAMIAKMENPGLSAW